MDPNTAPTVNPISPTPGKKFLIPVLAVLTIILTSVILLNSGLFKRSSVEPQVTQPTPTPSVIPFNIKTSKGSIISVTKDTLSIKTNDATESFKLADQLDIRRIGSGSAGLKAGQEVVVISSKGRATSIMIIK